MVHYERWSDFWMCCLATKGRRLTGEFCCVRHFGGKFLALECKMCFVYRGGLLDRIDSACTAHSQCWETLLSPAGVVETTVVVAVEPSAFDSRDDTGFRVERGVRTSGAPEGAVVRWEVASAWDTCPEGGAALLGTFALVLGASAAGSEGVGAVPFVGAVVQAGRARRGRRVSESVSAAPSSLSS